MTVIRTDEWLLEHYENPLKLCEKLTYLFDDISADDIHYHLTSHGMYRRPNKNGMKPFKDHNIWEIVKREEQKLKKQWNGPNIPIFIFPSDSTNLQLMRDYNGKSGLTFHDKLFLFISEKNTEKEIKALFTHEYNHVCRLSKVKKHEQQFVLLDTIIMEGLAENAVREKVGKDTLADWTSYFSDKQLEIIWKKLVSPHKDVPKFRRKHQQILYGYKLYPKMAGYCVGYYLVKKYMEQNSVSSKDLLRIPSEDIAEVEVKTDE